MELIRSLVGVRVLAAVEDAGSYSAAAARLGVTQSAVSQHVASLERLVGQPLVEPRTRPVELTVAGSVLVEHGRAVIARLGAAERDLAELAGSRDRRVRLGSFPTALATFVPRAVRRVRRDDPAITVSLVDEHMPALWGRLERREVDLAVVFGDAGKPDGMVVEPLFTDPYRLLLPLGHRLLAGGAPVRLRDLADETWVGATPGSTWFRAVERRCRQEGFDPRVGMVSDEYVAVQAFVQAGMGVAVVPGLASIRRVPGIETRAIDGSRPTRDVVVARPEGTFVPRGVLAMVDALVAVTRATTAGPDEAGRAAPARAAG